MPQDLWGEKIPKPRRKKRVISLTSTTTYSITGANDCAIIGHTLSVWDLAGCTICLDCGVHIFCPGCIAKHPKDQNAIPVVCERHEESQVML